MMIVGNLKKRPFSPGFTGIFRLLYLSLDFTNMKSYVFFKWHSISGFGSNILKTKPDNEFLKTFSGHHSFASLLFWTFFHKHLDFLNLTSILFQKSSQSSRQKGVNKKDYNLQIFIHHFLAFFIFFNIFYLYNSLLLP